MRVHPLWRSFVTWALISDINLEDETECKEWFGCFLAGAKICESAQSVDQYKNGVYMPLSLAVPSSP